MDKKQKNRESRLAVLKEAGEHAIRVFKPQDGETYCNFGTDYICFKMGFTGFKDLVANDMVRRMQGASDFAVVDSMAAQSLANDGRVVVAGIKGDEHGHVAVCMPGTTIYSGKWKEMCPMVANVGARNGVMSSNYAFDKKPSYYAWIESA